MLKTNRTVKKHRDEGELENDVVYPIGRLGLQ